MSEFDDGYQKDAAKVLRDAVIDPRLALASVALSRALGAKGRRLLERRKPAAIVIEVPSEQWVEPVVEAAQKIHGGVAVVELNQKRGAKETEAQKAARHLAAGHTVIGVSHAPDLLPDLLLTAATHRARVPAVDASVLGASMRLCLKGRVPARLRTLDFSRGDFDLFCACMPKGTTTREALANLTRVLALPAQGPSSHQLALPKLEDAVEYGAARDWGLDLAADICDLKAGRLAWSDVDRGCILEGPPGSGKSTFAKILGEACGLEVILRSVSDLFAGSAGYLDSVIKAQRELFSRAAAAAPCILFLDEINAMPDLATISPRGKDWWAPVVLDFYLLLDSAMSGREGVVVVGATNRVEDISPALLRPGRLERSIHIGVPDASGLANILRTHLAHDLPGADLMSLARQAEGATAAMVMDWVRSARRLSRRAGRELRLEDLWSQISPPEVRPKEFLYRAAIHEAGHAVLGVLQGMDLRRISVIAKGDSGGRTSFNKSAASLFDRAGLERQAIMILGGAAAEIECLKTISTGSGGARQSDFGHATKLVSTVHASYGVGPSLTWRCTPEEAGDLVNSDPEFRSLVEQDLQRLLGRARAIVRENRWAVLELANILTTGRAVFGDTVRDLLNNGPPVAGAPGGTDRSGESFPQQS